MKLLSAKRIPRRSLGGASDSPRVTTNGKRLRLVTRRARRAKLVTRTNLSRSGTPELDSRTELAKEARDTESDSLISLSQTGTGTSSVTRTRTCVSSFPAFSPVSIHGTVCNFTNSSPYSSSFRFALLRGFPAFAVASVGAPLLADTERLCPTG